LRGLGSDQTLVLENGKRRHPVALVNLFGARNRGNTGTDLNAIPLMAIESVQILRDGAAAQYGSDAIAGVINIDLKKRPGCEGVAGYGQYSEGDGKNWLASAYCGFRVGSGGIGITGEYVTAATTAPTGNPASSATGSRERHVYANGEIPTGPGRLFRGRRPAPRRLIGRVRARRRRLRRHPVAQLRGHVSRRVRAVHQWRPRRPLRDRRPEMAHG
jgi:iron complex outermembrane receptor protein